jgi:hypothetical protein
MIESDLQAAVMEYARLMRWRLAHFHDSRRQVKPGVFVGDADARGFPDLVLVRERLVIAELKGATTRVSAAQRGWIQALKLAGVETYIWRPKDWPEIERVLR